MDCLKYKPVGHRVLIEVKPPEHIQRAIKSGLALPESIRDREAFVADEGVVLALGENAFVAFDNGKPWCKVGDVVRVARGSGINIPDKEKAVIYRVVNDEDIYAIVNNMEAANGI